MSQANDERLRATVSAILNVPVESVNDQSSSDTIDTWDSLNHINLVTALEQEFGITLPADSLADTQSVGRLKAILAASGVDL